MKNPVFIVASSLYSCLGRNKQDSCARIQQIQKNGYENYLNETLLEGSYLLQEDYESQTQKLNTILTSVIEDAIKEAGYSKKQRKDLHIFIGSTSMNMAQNEAFNQEYLNHRQGRELINVGYGYVGDLVKEIVGSKYSSVGFLTACTSSVNAMITASKMIEAKKIKNALIVGVELHNKTTYKGFESLMLISNSKVYKPFDKASDGIILGEGCSAIILDAQKKHDNDFEILGSCSISDNYAETTTNPNGEVVAQTMDNAMLEAGITIRDLDLIKAHATGSENNNLSEARAIDILFEKYNTSCKVTALKPFIGHTLGASGTNEIVLIEQTLKEGFIPPTYGFKEKIQDIKFAPLQKTFYTQEATFLCNSVGFGGSNCAVVISNRTS